MGKYRNILRLIIVLIVGSLAVLLKDNLPMLEHLWVSIGMLKINYSLNCWQLGCTVER